MFPITEERLDAILAEQGIDDIAKATIRQICSVSDALAAEAGEEFVHLEIGNPGLEASQTGVDAECEALRRGVANKYPNIAGIPELKANASRFAKAFLGIDVPGESFIPTVGSMQGTFSVMSLLQRAMPGRDTILFINPGFPAQRSQAHLLGLRQDSFDIYEYRGERLRGILDEKLSSGRVCAVIYCSPNNPAWINLTEEELRILGEAADRYDTVIMEDLAYMGMDFRTDTGRPFEPPYVPTVARYTDRFILFLSGSKIFSYAGQRIATVCISPALFNRRYDGLKEFFGIPTLGKAYIFGVLYAMSSGTSHSAQCALAAMMGAAADGKLDFVKVNREYGRRAAIVKRILDENGFHIVYDHDADGRRIADGFFFTAGYGDMGSSELQKELMRYGISAISLPSTGSLQSGLRVCVSMISDDETFARFADRLRLFHRDHPLAGAKA